MSLAHATSAESVATQAPPQMVVAAATARGERELTSRLIARVAELRGLGYKICWIALPPESLTTLFVEGGDNAIELDPDPARDTAWFRGDEIRPSIDAGAWIYVEGQFDSMSRHEV